MVVLSDELMNCVPGTNGCLELRRRAFALDGRVTVECSRYPGSMARCSIDSVAPLRGSLEGWTSATIGRLSAGVFRRHPVTICKAPGQIPVGHRFLGVVPYFFAVCGGKGEAAIANHLHDHADHDKHSSSLLLRRNTILVILCQQDDVIYGRPPLSKARLLPREQWVDDWIDTRVDESLEDVKGDTQ